MKSYYASLCDTPESSNKYGLHRKLLLTQYDKEKYVRHFTILKFLSWDRDEVGESSLCNSFPQETLCRAIY